MIHGDSASYLTKYSNQKQGGAYEMNSFVEEEDKKRYNKGRI